MNTKRFFKHAFFPGWKTKTSLTPNEVSSLEQKIFQSERFHSGEIVVAIEGGLPLDQVSKDISPRHRAFQVFSNLKVWDTEENNGVLIYINLVDHAIEIVSDRGVTKKLSEDFWFSCCEEISSGFKEGNFFQGISDAIEKINSKLVEFYPHQNGGENELSNKVVFLT